MNSEEILRCEDLNQVPYGYEGLILVSNDHGNATLIKSSYNIFTEIWSVV